MKKKLLVVVMVIALLVSTLVTLTACGDKTGGNETETGTDFDKKLDEFQSYLYTVKAVKNYRVLVTAENVSFVYEECESSRYVGVVYDGVENTEALLFVRGKSYFSYISGGSFKEISAEEYNNSVEMAAWSGFTFMGSISIRDFIWTVDYLSSIKPSKNCEMEIGDTLSYLRIFADGTLVLEITVSDVGTTQPRGP